MKTEAEPAEEEWVINNVNSSFRKPPKLSKAATRFVRAALPSRRQPEFSDPAPNAAMPTDTMANASVENNISVGFQGDFQFGESATSLEDHTSKNPIDNTPGQRRPRHRRYKDMNYSRVQNENNYAEGSHSSFASKQSPYPESEEIGSSYTGDRLAPASAVDSSGGRSKSLETTSEAMLSTVPKLKMSRMSQEQLFINIKSGCDNWLTSQVSDCLMIALSEEKAKLSKAEKAAAYENCSQALKAGLSECSDPVAFITESILCLAALYGTAADIENMKVEKSIRTVVRILCESLDSHIACLPKSKGIELAAKNDPSLLEYVQLTPATKDEDLIEFNDTSSNCNASMQTEDPEIITMADLQTLSLGNWKEKLISPTDQRQLVDNLPIRSQPIIAYLSMKTFRLWELLATGQPEEALGMQLIDSLMEYRCMLEAIMCAKTLNAVEKLDFDDVVSRIVVSGDTSCILKFATLDEEMPRKLLSFFNAQLRFAYDGKFKIIPEDEVDKSSNLDVSPMRKLNERKVQKDLANFAIKIMDIYSIDPKEYYFVFLTNSYVSLRWLISQRACQQVEENDYSIEATSNYNGLIYVLCQDIALKRLAVKEFIDMRDPYAAPYFAENFDQMAFYNEYLATPMSQRLIGAIAGEQSSRSRVYLPRKKKKPSTDKVHYKLPENVQLVIIDNSSGLTAMRNLLRRSQLCGLDTEWIPHLAKHGSMRTSLMQIASELGVVFLLDLVKLCGCNDSRVGFDGVVGPEPEDNIQQETFDFLKDLFTDQRIMKLAYDFRGDIDMLTKTFPGIGEIALQSFIDLANLNSCLPDQSDSSFPLAGGGLTGVVETFLNRSLNKKQQISNWEQRPLSFEQAVYAAGDAYSLIEVFYTLYNMNHPILWDDKLGNGPGHL